MNINEKIENGISTFVVVGRIDSQSALDMDLVLQDAITQNKHKIILEMSGVVYMCSSGLRSLADVLTKTRKNGGDVKLADVNPKVIRILEMIGFDKHFSIHKSARLAVKDFEATQ